MEDSDSENFNFSISLLGSQSTHDTMIADICDLVDKSEEEALKPIAIRLGTLFLEIAICTSMRTEQEVPADDWPLYVEKFRDQISQAFIAYKLEILSKIDKSANGRTDRLFDQLPQSVKVFYDPEEPYISLITCNPKKKAVGTQPSTKDGYLIVTLKLSEHEIFPDYRDLLKLQ